jgi:butyrate kinase
MPLHILVINPGSTSTKLALHGDDGPIHQETVHHDLDCITDLSAGDQVEIRERVILDFMNRCGDLTPDAVCGRGGPMHPLEGGTYLVDDHMLRDLNSARYGEHASLLGGILAHKLAERWQVPAMVVDPVSVDEMDDRSRISGVPGIERAGRSHALNIKAVTRKAADELGKDLSETNFVVGHLGGGISIAAVRRGRIVDVNDALLGMGPFSPYRAGALPLRGVLDLAFSPNSSRDKLEKQLTTASGLYGYLGTGDLIELEQQLDQKPVRETMEAMAYQIVKEMGAMAAALEFRLDSFILTGGMSLCRPLLEMITPTLKKFKPLLIYPGESEMEALALGALRVLRGEEQARVYPARMEGDPS